MGHPKDLLKRQEITFDNHHPATPLKWDESLHFHKKMTVGSLKGKPVGVSGIFHVADDRGIDVTYDKGKSHPRIKDNKERDQFELKIKKEISGIIDSNPDDARVFIKRIMNAIDSISKGTSPEERKRRKKEAFDNVMDALGISIKQKHSLENRNGDLLSFYVDGGDDHNSLGIVCQCLDNYNRRYPCVESDDIMVYYIYYSKGKISLGELTPFTVYKYKWQGFKISSDGLINSKA